MASTWVEQQPGASVSSVELSGSTLVIEVQTPSSLPPVDELMDQQSGPVPDGIPVVVTTTLGQRIEAGTVGPS